MLTGASRLHDEAELRRLRAKLATAETWGEIEDAAQQLVDRCQRHREAEQAAALDYLRARGLR